mmetsp:Transcript_11733/g.33848  ORF Transcript_11733/g.33848 Transcript_11733/m.33848 type:complete len:160 (-) Transcript_11733:234-713(-)
MYAEISPHDNDAEHGTSNDNNTINVTVRQRAADSWQGSAKRIRGCVAVAFLLAVVTPAFYAVAAGRRNRHGPVVSETTGAGARTHGGPTQAKDYPIEVVPEPWMDCAKSEEDRSCEDVLDMAASFPDCDRSDCLCSYYVAAGFEFVADDYDNCFSDQAS